MLWTVVKEAAGNWSGHKDSRQGAALAYYSVFSLGPIILIAIAVAGFFFGRDAVSGQVASSVKAMLGDTGAKAVQAMLVDAGRPREGLIATLMGFGALIFAAIGVVVQLKDALNTVWEVGETPGHGAWHFIRNYVVSLAGAGTWLPPHCVLDRNRRACSFWKTCRAACAGVAFASRHHFGFRRRHLIAFCDDVQMAPRRGDRLV
jgi:hypothetical protein